MKESGIEWVEKMPLTWHITKISYIGRTSSGSTPSRSRQNDFFENANIMWVRTLDLNDGFVYDSSEKITEAALYASSCSMMPINTVCVAMYGGAGTIGKCGLLKRKCTTNQAICSIVCNEAIMYPEYLMYQLLALRAYWMKYAVGTRKDPNISQDIVMQMKVVVPSIEEQKEISLYLEEKCSEIDNLITRKEELLAYLESYKKSLIYEYVTGKKGVK